jgi:hypothetical protein
MAYQTKRTTRAGRTAQRIIVITNGDSLLFTVVPSPSTTSVYRCCRALSIINCQLSINIMRPLELALIGSILVVCVMTLALRRTTFAKVIYAIPAIIAIIHAIPLIEGVRWQLVPAYACALLLLVLAGQPAAFFKRGLVSFAVGGVLLSALLATILPVSAYPAPTGPRPVGTTILHLTDPNRTATYGDDPTAPREITIQIWYPTVALDDPIVGNRNAPVIVDADKYAAAFAQEFGVPAFVMSHIGLLKSYSSLRNNGNGLFVASDVANFPVIVGSHGWRGFRALHTTQFEELASHGYIAVGIDHTYGALATVLGDGTAVVYDARALPDDLPDAEYNANGTRLEDVFEGDIKFVLDELERLNAGGEFEGKMDLTRIGIFGHSTGAGAVVQTCQSDPRCKAGVGMDPWVEPLSPEQLAQGVSQPYLFMRSIPWLSNNNAPLFDQLYDASTGEKYNLAIAGTLHRDFTMQGILSPLLQIIGFTGSLDPIRTLDIVNVYMLTFFDHTLKGEPAPLLDGADPNYPEVTFE